MDEDGISINPHLPKQWDSLEYCFRYAGSAYKVVIEQAYIEISQLEGNDELKVRTGDQVHFCRSGNTTKIVYKQQTAPGTGGQ